LVAQLSSAPPAPSPETPSEASSSDDPPQAAAPESNLPPA
jgi:hypothetical protein